MYCCGLEMICYMFNLVKNMKFIFVRVKIYIIISDENLSKLIWVCKFKCYMVFVVKDYWYEERLFKGDE